MKEFLMKDNKGIFYELKESNMQTALQEFIERLNYAREFNTMIPGIIKVAESLLEKEKQQIVDAYRIASINNAPNKDINKYTSEYWQVNAELWYDKHYNQNK